jgi:rhodanese-related sulfurtransferase
MRAIRHHAKGRRAWFGPRALLTAVLALAVSLLWVPVQASQPSSPGKVLLIGPRSLEILLQSDPNLSLIDVRTPPELTGPLGKIPQARNVPLKEIEKNPEQFPAGKTLVLICRTGHRSLEGANLLAEHGYVVYSVQGGMQAWRELHPLAQPSTEELPLKRIGAPPGHPLDTGKPSPRKNGNDHPPEKNFFDNNMSC